jgi:hypothetical protein
MHFVSNDAVFLKMSHDRDLFVLKLGTFDSGQISLKQQICLKIRYFWVPIGTFVSKSGTFCPKMGRWVPTLKLGVSTQLGDSLTFREVAFNGWDDLIKKTASF